MGPFLGMIFIGCPLMTVLNIILPTTETPTMFYIILKLVLCFSYIFGTIRFLRLNNRRVGEKLSRDMKENAARIFTSYRDYFHGDSRNTEQTSSSKKSIEYTDEEKHELAEKIYGKGYGEAGNIFELKFPPDIDWVTIEELNNIKMANLLDIRFLDINPSWMDSEE